MIRSPFLSIAGLAIALATMASPEAEASIQLTLQDSNVNQAFLANENAASPTNPFVSTGPVGTFTAGYFGGTNQSFTAFAPTDHTNSFANSPGFEGYRIPNAESVPAVVINGNAGTTSTSYGISVKEGQMILHPGGIVGSAYNPPIYAADLRYVAGVTGSVYISGAFTSLHQNGTDVGVFVNGVSRFNRSLLGNGDTGMFGIKLVLNASDIVDFRVGPGSSGIGSTSTGLFANVVATPEPSTFLGALMSGMVMLGVGRYRRRAAR